MINVVLSFCHRICQNLLNLFNLSSDIVTLQFKFDIVVYNVNDLLGEGAYSNVYRARSKNTNKLSSYAIKKVLIQSNEVETSTRNEIVAFNLFKHQNIINCLDTLEVKQSTSSPQTIYFAFPLIKNGTLRDLLNANMKTNQVIPFKQILRDFRQILDAVNVLHSNNPAYIHQDIKPENILLDFNNKPLLTDFGSIRLANIEIKSRTIALRVSDEAACKCTLPYRAPELFDPPSNACIDTRSDVWSLGCLLFAWKYGYSPFESVFDNLDNIKVAECSHSRVLSKIPMKKRQMQDDVLITSFVEKILIIDFTNRFTTSQLIEYIQSNYDDSGDIQDSNTTYQDTHDIV